MCLSIPAKIIEINGDMAKAAIGNNILEIGLQLVDDVKINDYVFSCRWIPVGMGCALRGVRRAFAGNVDTLSA